MGRPRSPRWSSLSPLEQLEHATEVLKRRYKQLLRRKGVTGCDVGFRYQLNERTDQVCIRIYVDNKLTDHGLRAVRRVKLPVAIDGIPVDVIQRVYRSTANEQGPAVQCDTVQGGCAIGPSHNPSGWGTLGITLTTSEGQQFYLTNAHVALGGFTELPNPHHMIQPPVAASPRNIGTVVGLGLNQLVDFALIAPKTPPYFVGGVIGVKGPLQLGKVTQVDVLQQTKVSKMGARTQQTHGYIESVAAFFQAPSLGVDFAGQILVRNESRQPFILGGDSGSVLIKEATKEVVGLLHGSTLTDDAAFACHINDVVSETGLNLQVLNQEPA